MSGLNPGFDEPVAGPDDRFLKVIQTNQVEGLEGGGDVGARGLGEVDDWGLVLMLED